MQRPDIATEIETVGGSIDSYGGITASALIWKHEQRFCDGLDLLADVLLNRFSRDALEREREVQIADICADKDNLLKSASVAMRRTLFWQHRLRLGFNRHGRNIAKLRLPV